MIEGSGSRPDKTQPSQECHRTLCWCVRRPPVTPTKDTAYVHSGPSSRARRPPFWYPRPVLDLTHPAALARFQLVADLLPVSAGSDDLGRPSVAPVRAAWFAAAEPTAWSTSLPPVVTAVPAQTPCQASRRPAVRAQPFVIDQALSLAMDRARRSMRR